MAKGRNWFSTHFQRRRARRVFQSNSTLVVPPDTCDHRDPGGDDHDVVPPSARVDEKATSQLVRLASKANGRDFLFGVDATADKRSLLPRYSFAGFGQ